MDSVNEDQVELLANCKDFIAPDHDDGPYKRLLEDEVLTDENVHSGRLRLNIKVQDIQDFQQHLHRRLLTDPEAVIRTLEIAVSETATSFFPKTLLEDQAVKVGITGELGPHTVSPRALSSAHISKLVRVEGIVTKCSLVRPKIIKSVHYCEKTQRMTSREYRDVTSLTGQPTGSVYPQRDENGNPLTTEFGLCKYKNHQVVVVQELPETAPAGQLPRSTAVGPSLARIPALLMIIGPLLCSFVFVNKGDSLIMHGFSHDVRPLAVTCIAKFLHLANRSVHSFSRTVDFVNTCDRCRLCQRAVL